MGQKIVILGTGGTIAGTAASPLDHTGYSAGQLGVADVLAGLPAAGNGAGADRFIVEQLAQLDSKDMAFDVWVKLAQRVAHHLSQPEVQAVLITHGTDTLEETAYFLHALLMPAKPVVLTCAMRPATALAPDGPQNMMDALAVAASPGAVGVSVVCAGAVFGAEDVQKIHPYRDCLCRRGSVASVKALAACIDRFAGGQGCFAGSTGRNPLATSGGGDEPCRRRWLGRQSSG